MTYGYFAGHDVGRSVDKKRDVSAKSRPMRLLSKIDSTNGSGSSNSPSFFFGNQSDRRDYIIGNQYDHNTLCFSFQS